jgi:hypothetical protein
MKVNETRSSTTTTTTTRTTRTTIYGVVWTGFIWFMIRTSGGLL